MVGETVGEVDGAFVGPVGDVVGATDGARQTSVFALNPYVGPALSTQNVPSAHSELSSQSPPPSLHGHRVVQ